MQKILRLLKVVLWASLGIFLILFAISNRTPVVVGLWPFAFFIELPLYSVMFFGIILGLVLAGLVSGVLRVKSFTRQRQIERHAKKMEEELAVVSEQHHMENAKSLHKRAQEIE